MSYLRVIAAASGLGLSIGCASTTAPAECPAVAATLTASPPRDDLTKLDREQLANKLITVTLGDSLGKQVLDAMIESLRKMPGLRPGFIERLRENARVEELKALVVPIYVKTYDRETMIAAITFYESEQGKILVSKLPETTRLGIEVGQRWGKALAEKTLNEMGPTP